MNTRGSALVSFDGVRVDQRIAALFQDEKAAGAMLYLPLNIEDAGQTRTLTRDLRAAAGRDLLFAVDQEGGQLLAGGPDLTPFAGNMALGAVNDVELTSRVASAIGRELRAVGINVNLAPVVDIATSPFNPSMGIRSFGDASELVSTHTAAFVAGLQSEGVAATLKHFPGKGEASVDPHYGLPVLRMDWDRLNSVEFAPFRAGIEAGAKLLMVGHYGLPAITGDESIPASVSVAVLDGLVRRQLGFRGVIVTDALDMGAFSGNLPDAPLEAGADLLLYGPKQAGVLPDVPASFSPRLNELFDWLDGFNDPELSVVGCEDHREIAMELAERAVTLVRDEAGLLPLRLSPSESILAVMPLPSDLTPADTSSLVRPKLASAIRRFHGATKEIVTSSLPTDEELAAVVSEAKSHDVVIVGTLDATDSQAQMVESLLKAGVDTIAVAMRTPYDLSRYPQAPTFLCTFGLLPPSMAALASALFGGPVNGTLPVGIPGLYPAGHGIVRKGRSIAP